MVKPKIKNYEVIIAIIILINISIFIFLSKKLEKYVVMVTVSDELSSLK
jgi:hypothetical protein